MSVDHEFMLGLVVFAGVSLGSLLGWHAHSYSADSRGAVGGHLDLFSSQQPLRAAFREAMDECCVSVGTSTTTTSTPSSPNMQYDFWWWFKLAMWLGLGISVLGFSAQLGLFWWLVRPWLTGRDGTGSDCSSTKGARAISEEADISSLARAQVQAFRIKNHA